MSHGYDVTVWKIQTRYKTNDKGKRIPTRYVVRWMVEGNRFQDSYRNFAQADSFRSELHAASRKGEPFDTDSGLPISHARKPRTMSWYKLACLYAGVKWDSISPKHRSGIAYALTAITLAMFRDSPGRPSTVLISRALRHAFNKHRRDDVAISQEVEAALTWIDKNTRPVSDLAKPDVIRAVLSDLDKNRNGERAAPDTIRLRRITLAGALDHAVEEGVLNSNPLQEVKTPKHKVTLKQVDRRSVVNPIQARTLLLAAHELSPRLHAFFAALYFAALRPEEAVNLRKRNLSLPAEGWGEIHLEKASPEVGAEWTDTGAREERGLKHRVDDIGRSVPCSDELTAILHRHIEIHGTSSDGRLFRGARGGLLSSTVYGRAWAKVRQRAFTPEVAESPLAKRPYDLRHAAVSTWLNATNDPTRVAEWAGHSVSVLLRTYAKCLDGGEQQAREQVAQRLKGM